MSDPYVKSEIKNQVGYIEFFHPAHNSLPGDILAKLAQTITDAGNNDSIKVIVLMSHILSRLGEAALKGLCDVCHHVAAQQQYFSLFRTIKLILRKKIC